MVKKTALIGLLFLSLIYQGCEDDKDTSPPYISILFPEESSSVSEIITIQCEASDNDSVKFVELWIDSLATGLLPNYLSCLLYTSDAADE